MIYGYFTEAFVIHMYAVLYFFFFFLISGIA